MAEHISGKEPVIYEGSGGRIEEAICGIEELLDEARKSISDYCMSECRGRCCYGNAFDETGNIVRGDPCTELIVDGDRHLCSIHEDPARPERCKAHPLYLNSEKHVILADSGCKAVEEGRFDSFFEKFREIGYGVRVNSIL